MISIKIWNFTNLLTSAVLKLVKTRNQNVTGSTPDWEGIFYAKNLNSGINTSAHNSGRCIPQSEWPSSELDWGEM